MGGKEEGFSGTSIKDTWTEPRGQQRGGIEGGRCGSVGSGGGKMKTIGLEQQ